MIHCGLRSYEGGSRTEGYGERRNLYVLRAEFNYRDWGGGSASPRSLTRTHWDRKRERRARAQLALHPDLPAVGFPKLPTQGEPQPCAPDTLGCRPHPAELLKDLLLIFWGNADPGVADGDLHESIFWHCPDINTPTVGGELDRIRQQVQDDLADFALISLNLAKLV